MASDNVWYLVAAGVLALGLSNGFGKEPGDWAQQVVDRSASTADRVSGQVMRLADMGQAVVDRSNLGFTKTEAATARVQAHVACIQTAIARRQAEMARLQAERARVVALEQMHRALVIRPHQDFVMEISRPSAPPTDGTI